MSLATAHKLPLRLHRLTIVFVALDSRGPAAGSDAGVLVPLAADEGLRRRPARPVLVEMSEPQEATQLALTFFGQ